ncbi:hypothetical protein E3N88_12170 [Mikania micrantha]|uniref:Uncharacterized protein n=1 Tax=Mikania micrantha TaxID=192012 RepID=A0A5N6P6I1_9ASTR|nr:hypothetical protein E3N88_12170 [Mikania micrantha]
MVIKSFSSKSHWVSEIGNEGKVRDVAKVTTCVEDWIVQFARLLKDHVGFEYDSYLDLHHLGMIVICKSIGTSNSQESGLYADDLELYNKAEDSMEHGMQIKNFRNNGHIDWL